MWSETLQNQYPVDLKIWQVEVFPKNFQYPYVWTIFYFLTLNYTLLENSCGEND